jgi:hypothetical protein
MKTRRAIAINLAIIVLVGFPLAAQWPASEKLDLDALYRIKQEGLGSSSKVMEVTSYLTDVYGPRLAGSPNIKEAADYAQKTMREWGLSNVHLETFPFGRGWQNDLFFAHALTPRRYPLIGYPKAWTPGVNDVTGEAVLAIIQSEDDFATFRGKLRGKFAFVTPLRDLAPQYEAPGHRYTDTELSAMTQQPSAGRGGRGDIPTLNFPR